VCIGNDHVDVPVPIVIVWQAPWQGGADKPRMTRAAKMVIIWQR